MDRIEVRVRICIERVIKIIDRLFKYRVCTCSNVAKIPFPTNSGAKSNSPRNSPSDAVFRVSCSFRLSWVAKNCSGLSLHSSRGTRMG